MAMTKVAMGEIQTRWATAAVFHEGMMSRALNHINRARPRTVWGKKIGSRMNFWKRLRYRQ